MVMLCMDLYKFRGPATWGFIMFMVAIKTTFITDVQPLTMSGKFTNFSWIMTRIWHMGTNFTQKTFLNRIPGIDKYEHNYTNLMNRRHNENDNKKLVIYKNGDEVYVAVNNEPDYSDGELNTDDIRLFDIQNGELKEIRLSNKTDVQYSDDSDDKYSVEKHKNEYERPDVDQSQANSIEIVELTNTDKNKIKPEFTNELKNIQEENAKNPSLSKYYDNHPIKLDLRRHSVDDTATLLHNQQKQKREELMQFCKRNYISTNYFYSEMKRILRDRVVKDDLRLMVEELEKEGNEKFKERMLRFFKKYLTMKENQRNRKDIWRHQINGAVINILKDPYNDGE